MRSCDRRRPEALRDTTPICMNRIRAALNSEAEGGFGFSDDNCRVHAGVREARRTRGCGAISMLLLYLAKTQQDARTLDVQNVTLPQSSARMVRSDADPQK